MFVWFGYCFKPCGLFNLYTSIIHEIKSKVKCFGFIYLQFVTKVLYDIFYRLYNIFPISCPIYYINYILLHKITKS